MFTKPIFRESSVEKESSAVNGEYEIDISEDSWKLSNFLSLLSSPLHPNSRFGIGNY
jgi:secreted Zn-dependent insulinase-like peptidase